MKHAITQIVGKRITGLVVKKSDDEPPVQVFLLFEDGYYELYGRIHGTGRIHPAGIKEIRYYMPEKRIVLEVLEEDCQ